MPCIRRAIVFFLVDAVCHIHVPISSATYVLMSNALFKSKSYVRVVSRGLAAGSQPRLLAAMKRSAADAGVTDPSDRANAEMADPSDRAQSKRKYGERRIPLEQLGFWPGNRGTLGISGHHVHEVAYDVLTRRTKIARYIHASVIEIPKDMLAEIREANRKECLSDSLMPRFSPDIKYVLATKTHFVHAHKLAQEGTRFLFNDQKTPIRWQQEDTEGHEILANGPMCVVYDADLLKDTDAVNSLTGDDNLNSSIGPGIST